MPEIEYVEDSMESEELLERLFRCHEVAVIKYFMPETSVKKVKNGVLDSSDVEVDGHPRAFFFRIDE